MGYSTLIKRIFIIAKSKWILHALRGNFFSLASFEVVSNLKEMVPELDYIIDVGANSGQFSKVVGYFYPKATIDAFEPLPNLYSKIQKTFENKKNIRTYNVALGNENGTVMFNKNNYGHISSILEISNTNKHYPKQKNDLKQIVVEIKTLDSLDLIKNKTRGTALLKLDVQGYELEVLKGATETINNIDYIVIEANLEELYYNQPSFTKMNSYLNKSEFELMGMLDFNLGDKNKYIEVDLLYKKTEKSK